MIRTARRTRGFTESIIRETTRVARESAAINLAQGFPDFAAPTVLKEAACTAIRADVNQYAVTWGTPRLRRALAAKYAADYGMDVDEALEITVTCGATEAMAAVLLALIDPGDEVLIFDPFYENYGPDAVLCGAPRIRATRRDRAAGCRAAQRSGDAAHHEGMPVCQRRATRQSTAMHRWNGEMSMSRVEPSAASGHLIVAQRTVGFTDSVIREMTRVAHESGALNLAQGFPDFDAPEVLKEAACAAIRADVNQYAVTWGAPRLRHALAAKYARDYGIDVDEAREITVTCGATEPWHRRCSR